MRAERRGQTNGAVLPKRTSSRYAVIATAALLAGLLAPLTPISPDPAAGAVTFPSGLQTGLQIDGDKTASGSPPGRFDGGRTSAGLTCSVPDADPPTTGSQLPPTIGQTITCGVASAADPHPSVTKTVVSSTQNAATGVWSVHYGIEVSLPSVPPGNPADPPATYSLTDELRLGDGIEIVQAFWTGQGRTDEFDEDGIAVISTDVSIAAGATHVYNVWLDADVTAAAIDGGTTACLPGDDPAAGGFLNTAELTSADLATVVADCTEPVFPEVEKTAADPVTGGDGTWIISYDLTARYPAGAPDPAPESIGYTLTDVPALPDGVDLVGNWTAAATGTEPAPTNPTWDGVGEWAVVEAGALTPDDPEHTYRISAVVRIGAEAAGAIGTCEEGGESGVVIRNVGGIFSGAHSAGDGSCIVVPLDVGIVKTSDLPDGETSVEAGDTFDYVLAVTNTGGRPVQNVRVTDDDLAHERLVLQALSVTPGVTWTGPGLTADGVDLTIDELPVGATVEIRVTVELLPAGAAGSTPHLPPGAPRPEAPAPIEQFDNTACVTADFDTDESNDCDDAVVPVRDLTGVVYTTCLSDAPQLGWIVRKSEALRDAPIDLVWTPDQGAAQTDPANVMLSQAGGSVDWSSLIGWPGTAFTPGGVATDYPGWRPIAASDIIPGSNPVNYLVPGTSGPMTDAQRAELVFNGLILDDSELNYAWRLPTTVTVTANPALAFAATYPAAIPECTQVRTADVRVAKTASVDVVRPGGSFTYALEAANHSDAGAAEAVVLTDAIPADIRIDAVTWVGMGDPDVFPNWQTCELTGRDSAGFGGSLTCVLFGPLQPAGANEGASVAPTITLAATVASSSTASSVANVATLRFRTFDDPDDVVVSTTDSAVVTVAGLPPTGGSQPTSLLFAGLVALLAGAILLVLRRVAVRRARRIPNRG